jgi:hypothetical protein
VTAHSSEERRRGVAHASRYHWGQAPECRPENLARGEWLVSRVYCVLGRGEPALWHAERCLEHVEEAGLGGWDLAYAYEALARASAGAGDGLGSVEWRDRARAAGDAIADPEDRGHFESDFATL